MKKITLFMFLSLLLGCSDKIEKPEKFLEKEDMTNLLYDLTLYSSAKSFQTEDSIIKVYSQSNIFIKYGLDSLSFAQLNDYYIKHPEIYAQIFDTINKRFQKQILQTEALPDDPRDTIGASQIIRIRDFKKILK